MVNNLDFVVGGGFNYKLAINRVNANYTVSNSRDLVDALTNALAGDIIYIAQNIDVTDLPRPLVIPGGVTIASNRGWNTNLGAKIIDKKFVSFDNEQPLFITNGENIRITGLQICGPNGESLDFDYKTRGFANFIKVCHNNFTFDNNYIQDYDKWAIWLYKYNGSKICYNTFRWIRLEGFGYAIWCGGTEAAAGHSVDVYGNYFEGIRHCIGSSGHTVSWTAWNNVIMPIQSDMNFNRHNYNAPFYGGLNTVIRDNLFLSKNLNYGLERPNIPEGSIAVMDNVFVNPQEKTGQLSGVNIFSVLPIDNIKIANNEYNYELRPASVTISPDPINLNKIGLFADTSGEKYLWKMGDGTEYNTRTVIHTYKTAGLYEVTLYIFDSFGYPTNRYINKIKIDNNSDFVSFGMKSNYTGGDRAYARIEILHNDTLLLSVNYADNYKWRQIVVPLINTEIENKIDIRFRVVKDIEIPFNNNIYLYLDDIYANIEKLVNGNLVVKELVETFDSSKLTSMKLTSAANGATTTSTFKRSDAKGGEQCFCIGFPRLQKIKKDSYIQLSFTIKF